MLMKNNRHMHFLLKYIWGLIIFAVSQINAQTAIPIVNGDFEAGTNPATGWSPSGYCADWINNLGAEVGQKQGSWSSDIWGIPMADPYAQQSVSVPNGYYKVTALLYCWNDWGNRQVTTTRLFANSNSTLWGSQSYYNSSDIAILTGTLGETLSYAGYATDQYIGFKRVTVYTQVTNGVLNFGVKTNGHNTSYAFSFQNPSDTRTSGYVGFDDFKVYDVSNDATLSNLTLNTGTLKSQFNPAQTTYLAILPQGTTTVTPTATPSVPGTVISGANAVDVSSGSGTSTITVTALDGNTTKTYTINYVVWSPATALKLHSYTFTNGATDSPYIGIAAVNGTINGSGTISNGVYSNASDGYVSLDGTALALNTYNGVTLEAYIKASAGLNNDDWVILSTFGNDGDNYLFMSNTRGGWLGTTCSAKANGIFSELAFFPKKDDDNLHHIVTTLLNDTLKLYFDGVLLNKTGAAPLLSDLGTAMAYLGKSPWGWDPLWKGTIDEFNIYEGELSASQVIANYQAMANKNVTSTETAALNMYKNVTVRNGGCLTLTTPANIENLKVQSGGTLLDNGNLTSSNISIQQYIPSGRNWYISSPVSDATSAILDAANTSNKLYWYDQEHGTTAPWPQIADNSTSLTSMVGYIANIAISDTLRFNGAINTGQKSITLHRTQGQTKEGFNLIGNPYPSYVSWDAAEKSNIEPTMWYRTRNAGNTAYVFDTYNSVGQIGTSLNGEQINCNIPPLQAFWVRVKAAGDGSSTTGTVTFENTMRSHKGSQTVDETTIPDVIRKTRTNQVNSQKLLRLQVSNGVNSDETILLFNTNAADGLDDYDSYKMSNNNDQIPEIYTQVGSTNLVINGMSGIETNNSLPLGFKTGQNFDSFMIKATQISNFDGDTKIFIRDKVLNKEQEITNGETYTFSSVPTTDDTRFSILFKSPSITTDLNKNVLMNAKTLVDNNNKITITYQVGFSFVGSASVYNCMGQMLENCILNSPATRLQKSLAPGIYFVEIEVNGQKKTEKIIMR